jgi:hypothetical protein
VICFIPRLIWELFSLSLGDMPCYGGGGSYIYQYVINHIYVYQITIILMISRLVEGHRREQIRI